MDGDIEIMGDGLALRDEVDEFVADLARIEIEQANGVESDLF